MARGELVAGGPRPQSVTRVARVRSLSTSALFRLPVAILLLLIASAGHGEPPTPTVATGCCHIKIRWFHARVQYYPNSDAVFNPSRLILLAGDVQVNPGPASEPSDGGHQLRIYYQNVRSLKNKLSVLRSEAPALRKFDVISLTETWLNSDVATPELELGLSGYTVFRRD